jgi:hypothetical protein
MRTVRWHGTRDDPGGADFVRSSLNELAGWLSQDDVGVDISFVQMHGTGAAAIEASLIHKTLVHDQHFDNWQEDLWLQLNDLSQKSDDLRISGKILLYCPGHTALREAVRRRESKILWGGSLGFLSMVWQGQNKQLLWHETLHLLGAEDCYDFENCKKQPKCLLDSCCIMQWEPCPENCGEELVLCAENIARVQASNE